MTALFAFSLASLVAPSTAPASPPSPAEILQDSNDVIAELRSLRIKSLPPALLADAHAVAVFPAVMKAGFVVAVRTGHGVLVCRTPGGAWGEPTFITLEGGGIGLQAGVESADLVLVFKSRKGLDRVLDGKGRLTIGAGAGLAAGPIGRHTEAGTDTRMVAEIVSYSRSRGAFVGAALEGAVLSYDRDVNREYQADPRKFGPAVEAFQAHLNAIAPARPRPEIAPPPHAASQRK
jgi:lipid-binding SYLF domain-containing protein